MQDALAQRTSENAKPEAADNPNSVILELFKKVRFHTPFQKSDLGKMGRVHVPAARGCAPSERCNKFDARVPGDALPQGHGRPLKIPNFKMTPLETEISPKFLLYSAPP